jgi:murein DD-endopeptidase MepM/ murein hydrolase activator NlpD
MNIIIVAKQHARPWALNLKCWRMRAKLFGLAILCVLCFGGAGFAAALLLANPSDRALREVYTLRAQIDAQKQNVAQLEASSQRGMDALAVQLGALQARALRLDALGERLARAGKLDDAEFNFAAAPAQGGPEDPDAAPQPLDASLAANIGDLRDRFQLEETRLNVLEELLLDRSVDNALLPKGYPVATGYIGSGYGTRTDPINGSVEHHMGLDFDAPVGSAIRAVADGVVSWSGERSGYGNVVEIDHGNGYMTRYAHNRKNLVRVGQRVHAGEEIAFVGETGRATGPHCHFEVWLRGKPVNPLAYVNSVIKKI